MNTTKHSTVELAKKQESERIIKMLNRLNTDLELQAIVNHERYLDQLHFDGPEMGGK